MTSQKKIMTSSHDDITKNCDITKIIRFLGILTEIEFILRKKSQNLFLGRFKNPVNPVLTILEKSLKTLLDGCRNIICANFQLSNPYGSRKFTFDRQYTFSVKILEFRTPKKG